MKTSLLLLLSVLVVVAGVYVAVQMFAVPASEVAEVAEEVAADTAASADERLPVEDTTPSREPFSGSGSFLSLLEMGMSIQCDYQYTPETGGAVAGTSYIDGRTGRVRSDFEMQQAGERYESSLIVKDDRSYVWTNSAYGNFAIVSDVSSDGSVEAETAGEDMVSLDDEVSYDCRPWTVEESRFALPAGVEFQTMEQMMQARMQDAGLPEGFELPPQQY